MRGSPVHPSGLGRHAHGPGGESGDGKPGDTVTTLPTMSMASISLRDSIGASRPTPAGEEEGGGPSVGHPRSSATTDRGWPAVRGLDDVVAALVARRGSDRRVTYPGDGRQAMGLHRREPWIRPGRRLRSDQRRLIRRPKEDPRWLNPHRGVNPALGARNLTAAPRGQPACRVRRLSKIHPSPSGMLAIRTSCAMGPTTPATFPHRLPSCCPSTMSSAFHASEPTAVRAR